VPRSPWQNGHIGRLIGSIRRECLDHIVVGGKHPLPLRAIQPAGKFLFPCRSIRPDSVHKTMNAYAHGRSPLTAS
jgi:hypothetical protein